MSNTITNVIVAKPVVTGGVSVAAVGTALPTDSRTALAVGFNAAGYVTDAGVVKSEKRNTGVVYAWGGDTVAATRKGMDVTFKLGFAELLNASVQGLIYNPSRIQALSSVAHVTPPVLSAPTPSASGGTMATGTYSYKFTWVTSFAGESLPSNEVTATTTTNVSSVAITVGAAPAGITKMNVYRTVVNGGVGNENLYAANVTAATTYTDTGAGANTSTPVPTVDTSGQGNRMVITATSSPTPKQSLVFDMYADTEHLRIVVPIARVMDVGDVTFKDDSIAAAMLTIQAFPDSNGAFFYQYSDDGVFA